jgi:hypothetical protein
MVALLILARMALCTEWDSAIGEGGEKFKSASLYALNLIPTPSQLGAMAFSFKGRGRPFPALAPPVLFYSGVFLGVSGQIDRLFE